MNIRTRTIAWLVVMIATGHVAFCAKVVKPVDSTFKPVCVGADVSAKSVRPGGQVALSLRFRNNGDAPAKSEYEVFIHLEYPDKDCRQIRLQADHSPMVPTTAWEPGVVVGDGATVFTVPDDAPEGKYYIHVGVFSLDDSSQPRFADQYVGEIQVAKNAPDTVPSPPKMAAAEVSKRRANLSRLIADGIVVQDSHMALAISRKTGMWAITDKSTGEVWHSGVERDGFADVTFNDDKQSITRTVRSFADVRKDKSGVTLVYKPDLPNAPSVRFRAELLSGGKGIRFSYAAVGTQSALRVAKVRLPKHGLWAADTEHGYIAFPCHLGIMVSASEGLPSTTRYTAYSNYKSYSMAMFGLVKNGSALLVHWDDPYTQVEVQRSWVDEPAVPGRGIVSASFILTHTATSFVVKPIGKGGYVEIAKAYREVAKERGLLRTWADKIKANPSVEKIIGAADFKPFVLSRVKAQTRWNTSDTERVGLGYTFDECARIAEHLHTDVSIDKAMYVLAGWIHRGYDNQHPDILPAAPECGGNDALASCSQRIKALGFLFGLHDNYEDMYRDAPSWDETYIMRNQDGSLRQGGVWAGGQAYITCSSRAIALAKREQNVPAVKQLFDPTIYFIDTIFAAPLFECFSKDHPLSLNDDIRDKRALCEYARRTFGLFGSEEGQEWGVPCADYFEGILSQRTQPHPGDIVIPLFEIVYGDCISLYTHQGDRATPERSDYILDHILYAEMPVYHFGGHLYFEREAAANPDSSAPPFAKWDGNEALCRTDRFIRNTYEILSPLNRITAHTPMTAHEFLTADRKVERSRFGDVEITVNYGEAPYRAKNAVLPHYGFLVESPTFVAFHATEYGGRKLTAPTMLTARSLDGKPLAKSSNVKLYVAFGDRDVRIAK